MPVRLFRGLIAVSLLAVLAGCHSDVLRPAGDIALQQRDLIYLSTFLMLLIIVPVMLLTLLFAWRYRQSNQDATYDPEWSHSTKLELVIWSAPLAIIIALGTVTWIATHKLDPYRPLDRLDAARALPADVQYLDVEVVALDWKWLFILPEQGVATVNDLALPVDRPVRFRITASTVMNTFYVPTLAGMIYAMPGMQTELHAVVNQPVDTTGVSAHYSGAGFTDMRFRFRGLPQAEFEQWVAQLRADGGELNREVYLQLEQPTRAEPVRHYAKVDPALFKAVLNMCVDPNKMCMSDMMAIDAKGGLGKAGIFNVSQLSYDAQRARGLERPRPNYVLAMCDTDTPSYLARTSLSGEAAPRAAGNTP
ncbi:ubiquinol oxidase subunit II [Solimonas variicoloris]|uniref:ubiquinol oxidase subunit II n=1 Tax=Solimonas variicoloris TaxID=254408 RepID=UPI0003A79007|nr:ubiquinol oxidase subunit II [Solimonas variicoloris]